MSYFYLFLISFLLSLAFTFLAKLIGFKYSFFDNPKGDELKIHKKPIPFTGGFAMFATFAVFFVFLTFFNSGKLSLADKNKLVIILIGGFLSFVYGLWDDLKWVRTMSSASQKLKLFVQIFLGIVVAAIFSFAGIYWEFIPNLIVGFIVSAVYFLVIFNAVNIQDGLDGLLGGISIISLIGFLVISLMLSNLIGIFLALILLGAVLGFLFFNWNPASIFMGNNGSQFLAFMMTFFAIYYTIKPYNFGWTIGPLFIIGVPLLNILFVTIRRAVIGQSIFKADRHHLYDKILGRVQSIRKTVLINYFIQIILVIIGVLLMK